MTDRKSAGENVKIEIGDGFAVDKALKKFKRLCDAYGIVKEYRDREFHQKPSVKEKLKREAADKRRRKTAIKGSRSFKKV
jgi:small subunit ribosomal protein S21